MSKVYLTPEQKIRQRYSWFLEAQSLHNVSLACKRLGNSGVELYLNEFLQSFRLKIVHEVFFVSLNGSWTGIFLRGSNNRY
jgi:hypothetical protein